MADDRYSPDNMMDLARAHMQVEMPAESAGVRSMGPMHWWEKLLVPGADALTLPFGRVAYDPSHVPPDQSQADDVMAHELTHVGQAQRRSILSTLQGLLTPAVPYAERPDEKAAYAVETRREQKRHDINLDKR